MHRIRWKIVGLFFLSAGLAVGTVFAVVLLAALLYQFDLLPFEGLFRTLYQSVGVLPVAVGCGIVLFVVYVFVFSLPHIRYLEELKAAMQRIALGDLETAVPVRTRDELGQLADHMNRMAKRLKTSLDEERRAVKSKQELVTNVSHDLRTPLTSIFGYLQYIRENRYKDEVELMYYVDIAYQKARRLERMVNDLFDYTRMAYGQTRLKRTPIDLMELMTQLAAELDPIVRPAGMELHLDGPEEPLTLLADGDKLVRVFENLLSNAVRYGKDGRRIDVVARADGDRAIVRVVNYGEPIPAAELPFIFERFHRVDKSRSDETGGTGLGLAIARSIVELHGGTIEAASSEAETCFTVTLPLRP